MSQPQEVKASLGCGTLILIAVIVILFNGHNDHDQLEKKIDRLTTEVGQLKAAIQAHEATAPAPKPGPTPLPLERE